VKKRNLFSLSFALWCITSLCCAVSPPDCIHCWLAGVELSKNRNNYPEAFKAYTAAIQAQETLCVPYSLYLYNERGNLALKMQAFDQAIQDFSVVLSHKEVAQEEMMDALWGRGQAYLASGKMQEFERDRKRLDEIEPFVIPLEETQDFIILKLGSHVLRESQSQQRFVKVLLMQRKIKSKQDVIITPSGLAIVKKMRPH
jgi:tetratricopeptide (TPR) repeat protein